MGHIRFNLTEIRLIKLFKCMDFNFTKASCNQSTFNVRRSQKCINSSIEIDICTVIVVAISGHHTQLAVKRCSYMDTYCG